MAKRATVPALIPGISAVTLTTGWQDVGAKINTLGWDRILFHPDITQTDSLNIRLRVTYEFTFAGTDDRTLLIKNVSASSTAVEHSYYEFSTDDDYKSCLNVELGGGIPFVQLQAQTGTVGSTASTIDATTRYNLVRDN